MIQIKIDENQIRREIAKVKRDFGKAVSESKVKTSFFVTNKISDYMKSGGEGKWKGPGYISQKYEKKYKRLVPRESPLFLIRASKYPRFILKKNLVEFGFAYRSKPKFFEPELEALIAYQEKGFNVQPSEELRRFLAWKGIFVKKNTTFEIPERPLFEPILLRLSSKVEPFFVGSLVISLQKKGFEKI